MSGEIRRARIWLSAGALVGIFVGARGVLRPARAPNTLPEGAVAMVGEVPIAAAEYARAVAAVESDRRDHQADADLRRHVLDRLVDEELLVQRALELGLPTRDARLRGQVASAMIEGVLGEPAGPPPSDDDLRAFHAAHAERFTRRGRVAVEALFFRGEAAAATARAEAARARIEAGEPLASIASAADTPAAGIPRGPLPVAKLAEYVGPAAAHALDGLRPGAVSAPLPVDGGAWIARLVAREGGELARFEDVRAEVLAELRRDEDDARLRRWLDTRRKGIRVLVREPLP